MSDLEQLKACSNASKKIEQTIEENRQITLFNDNKDNLAGAAQVVWGNRKKDRENQQTAWDNRKNWLKENDEDINRKVETRNWACEGASWGGRDGWCSNDHGGDWEFDSHSQASWQACSFVHKCKKKDSVKWREAENKTRNEKGERPANFNEPKPEKNQGIYIHKNFTEIPSINLQCCSNAINVNLANQASADLQNISQKCNQEIEQKIQNLQNTTQPIAAQPIVTQPSQEIMEESVSSEETPIPVYKNSFVIFSFGGSVISSSLILCLVMLIFLLN